MGVLMGVSVGGVSVGGWREGPAPSSPLQLPGSRPARRLREAGARGAGSYLGSGEDAAAE